MSKTKKKKPKTVLQRSPTQGPAPRGSGPAYVYASVHRSGGDEVGFAIDGNDIPAADAQLAVDCGRVVYRNGFPELQLAQRHPLNPFRATRLLVIRYTPEVFAQRAEANEGFLEGLQAFLEESGAWEEKGASIKAMEEMAAHVLPGAEPPPAVTIDAEGEFLVRTGFRAAMLFLCTDSLTRHRAVRGDIDSLPLQVPIEATMPATVLADLLVHWRDQVKERLP